MRVAVYFGSSPGDGPGFAEAAREVVRGLADAGHSLVYGGGRAGLMGVVGDTAVAAGMDVLGVTTRALVDGETAHTGLGRLEVVDTMGERKARMADAADAMVALPGGVGTLEEFFEVWTAQILGIHRCPVALYDVDGYWDPLVEMVDTMVRRGFLSAGARDGLVVADTPAGLLDGLRRWEPPRPRWERPAPATDGDGE